MQQLQDALERVSGTEQGELVDESGLIKAAESWATYCLRNHYGDLLERGLAISRAIVEYELGLTHPEKLRD